MLQRALSQKSFEADLEQDEDLIDDEWAINNFLIITIFVAFFCFEEATLLNSPEVTPQKQDPCLAPVPVPIGTKVDRTSLLFDVMEDMQFSLC